MSGMSEMDIIVTEISERTGIPKDHLVAYVEESGTCYDGRYLWRACHECEREPVPADVRDELDERVKYVPAVRTTGSRTGGERS